MASLTTPQIVTAPERKPRWLLPRRSRSWGVAAVLAVALLVSTGSLTVLAQRQAATIAAQAAIIRQQADTLGQYEQTNEALLRAAHQYAARLVVLSEVAELDRAIIELAGQRHGQRLAMARALHEGGHAYAEAAMVEQLLQHRLDDVQAQRQLALAR